MERGISQNQGSEHLLLLLLLACKMNAVGFLRKCGHQHGSQYFRGSRLEEEVKDSDGQAREDTELPS